MNEETKKESKPVPGSESSDRPVGRDATREKKFGKELVQVIKKTIKEKREELHQALEKVIAREARQWRISHGEASAEEILAEAQAVEDDARAARGRIQALQDARHPSV